MLKVTSLNFRRAKKRGVKKDLRAPVGYVPLGRMSFVDFRKGLGLGGFEAQWGVDYLYSNHSSYQRR